MPLTKAKIIVEEGNNAGTIEVLFNPNEYSLDGSNEYNWEMIPGLDAPVARFISGESTSLSMELFFDTYEQKSDVRVHTGKVARLLDVDASLHRPPICKFVWGSLTFKGVLEEISQKFTMFLDTGIPVRATAQVTFREYENIREQLQETPRESSDRTKQKVLKQGDQLWMIAGEEYRDPGFWREIARANNIDNPRLLETGRNIIVPPLE